jgi:peptidoglycan/xylan/chitin deacetylase (PgdA/CDA1 family)
VHLSRPADLLRLLAAAILLTLMRLTGRRAGLVLVYHRIAEADGDPARELVPAVGEARFDRQLRHLARFYLPVPAAEIQRAAAARRRGGRFPVALTFDDDLGSHRAVAAPALLRRGIPAAFFLCGASLDGPAPFWWERLQRLADADRLGELERELAARGIVPQGPAGGDLHELARAVEAMAPAERDVVAGVLRALEPGEADPGLAAEDVATLAEAGFAIGFHTRRHDRLHGLDETALRRALTEGRSALERLAGAPITTIAYPHGRGDARVAREAMRAGFTVAFTGKPGPVTAQSDPLLLARIEPVGEHGTFALDLVRTLRAAGRAMGGTAG